MSVQAGTIAEHVEEAKQFRFPEISQEPLPLDLQEALVFPADPTSERQAARRRVLEYWRARKEELRVTDWPPGRPLISRIEFKLLGEMMKETRIYGEKLLDRLQFAFPVVGIFDEPTIFPRKNRARPVKSISDLLQSQEKILREIERIAANEDAEETMAVWESFVEECESGSLEGPYCLDSEEDRKKLPAAFLPLRRFIVTQQSYSATAHALLFGEEASVINFNVYSLVATALGRRILRIPLVSYFDDFAAPGPEDDEKQIAEDLDEFFSDLLAITFEKEKDELGPRIRFLGVFHTVLPDGVLNEVCPVRAEHLRGVIRGCLESNCLRPDAAESLAGALNFCASSSFGRLGRAFLVPVYGRAHCVNRGGQLGDRLRRSLQWFETNLANFRHTVTTRANPPPVIIYTDACGAGLLGAVLFDGETAVAGSWWSADRHGDRTIEYFEMEAVVVALKNFADRIRGRRVLIFIDNESAQGAVTKGHSTDNCVADLIHEIWSTALALGLDIWFERVISALNVADGPSRDFFETCHALGCEIVHRAFVDSDEARRLAHC
eukprot:g19652.t1